MIELITFDLDDTLWDNGPVIRLAVEQGYNWLLDRHPELAKIHDVASLDALKEEVRTTVPELESRLSEVRIVTIAQALESVGYDPSTARHLAEQTFDEFNIWRHKIELFEGVEPMLKELAKDYRLAVITNGNADVNKIGLGDYFEFSVHAEHLNRSKPAPEIFHQALQRAGLPSEKTLHVGDNLITDVFGAANVGMRTLWFNPNNIALDEHSPVPDITVTGLDAIPEAIRAFVGRQ